MPLFLFVPMIILVVLMAVPGGPMLTIAVESKTGSPLLAMLSLVAWWSVLFFIGRSFVKDLKL